MLAPSRFLHGLERNCKSLKANPVPFLYYSEMGIRIKGAPHNQGPSSTKNYNFKLNLMFSNSKL